MTDHYLLETYLIVSISDDKTEAYLQFLKQDDEFSCTQEDLERFIHTQQVKYGLDRSTLQQISENPKKFYSAKTPIAFGFSPVQGIDGRIEMVMKLAEGKGHSPLESDHGKVDHKEINNLNNVRKGQIIAKRIEPIPGKLGMSVMNEAIPFKTGKEANFKVGKNVVVNEDKTAMYAALDGMITISDKSKINVFPIYEVNGDVDYSVGNIDFVGNVIIRGNVLTGFRIKAAGDIRVIGGVEGAEIDANGSVEITSGIIGYNKGHVKAGVNVKTSFIQDGNVIAGEDVIVSQSIMHSNIRAAKNVICKDVKGLIVGGSIQAGEKVIARTVGNTMSTITTIEVGVVPELRNELTELRNQMRFQADNIVKSEQALNLLNQLASVGQLSSDKLSMRAKLNATLKSHVKEQSENKERILDIEKMLEDTNKSKVEIINTIYGGSKIVIGRYTRFVKDTAERVSFYYSEGDIMMVPYI
ncbi:DUF342 domain-containing protein [Paenibacillus glacialis]|uniref:Polymerase n=1 Tax=Paenibacillus glacialis TaxID=494026 RepID=A0A168K0Q4_9BACL|nr:FapA family protein [Paenibacillus glacialis]OAB41361.1 polymerase [Paenibacillus glacialis]